MKQQLPAPAPQHAFTLMELLIVVSIISLLCGLSFPLLKKAQESSHRTQCLSNLRQISSALYSYASDHDNTLPPVSTIWRPPGQETLWPYQVWVYAGYSTSTYKDKIFDARWQPQAVGNNIFRCPAARINKTTPPRVTELNGNLYCYGLNCSPATNEPRTVWSQPWTSPIPLSRVSKPSATMMVCEVSFPLGDNEGYVSFYGRMPHGNNSAMFLYYDGHAEHLRYSQLPTASSATFWSGQ